MRVCPCPSCLPPPAHHGQAAGAWHGAAQDSPFLPGSEICCRSMQCVAMATSPILASSTTRTFICLARGGNISMKLICSFHSGSVVLVSTDVSPWEGQSVKATEPSSGWSEGRLGASPGTACPPVPPADRAGQALDGAASLLLPPSQQSLCASSRAAVLPTLHWQQAGSTPRASAVAGSPETTLRPTRLPGTDPHFVDITGPETLARGARRGPLAQ